MSTREGIDFPKIFICLAWLISILIALFLGSKVSDGDLQMGVLNLICVKTHTQFLLC